MKNNEQREMDEQRENMAVAVMNDMKKKIAKLKRLKEIEVNIFIYTNILVSKKHWPRWSTFVYFLSSMIMFVYIYIIVT